MDRLAFDIDRRHPGGRDNDHVLMGSGLKILKECGFARARFAGNEGRFGGVFHKLERGEKFLVQVQLFRVKIRDGQWGSLVVGK